MHSNPKNSISRRDFLKGLGLTGSGALLTFLDGRGAKDVQASPPGKSLKTIPLEANAAIFMYMLDVSGSIIGYFTHCGNMGYETETVDVSLASGVIQSYQPGKSRFLNITLERGLTASMDMWEWMEMVKAGSDYRFDAALTALDQEGSPIAEWNLINCWPCEVSAILTTTATERTILTLEYIERVA